MGVPAWGTYPGALMCPKCSMCTKCHSQVSKIPQLQVPIYGVAKYPQVPFFQVRLVHDL